MQRNSLSYLFLLSSSHAFREALYAAISRTAQKTFAMHTGIPTSTMRSAPPALGDDARPLPSYGQLHQGSASRLPAPIPVTAATRIARPSGMVASSSPRSGTSNRNQRPVSTTAETFYQRYSVSSYENTTPNHNRFTAGTDTDASPNRPTSTVSQPEHGDTSYFVWARRQDRLATIQSPVRGHNYAAAGTVRSYHRVPSALRSEEDAASTKSRISSITESDNASASTRWGDPAGALRHATHAVAPSIHSQAGRIEAASLASTKREDSVTPISRYNRTARLRTHSTPVVPSRPTASEQRPRTFLDMHDQYERAPAYRPQAQQVEWGSNFSPHSPGYTLEQIRQRRSTLSRGFPQPHNGVTEQRFFAGPFVDAPGRITASSTVERVPTRKVVSFEQEARVEVEEEQKTPGKWRKMSGLFTKKLGRKGKDASPDQISPHASPSTSHSMSSPVDTFSKSMAESAIPTPPPTTPHAMRARKSSPPSPLMVPPIRLRPAARIVLAARDVQHSPVSPLSDAEANQGIEGLSPVSSLSEHSSPPDQRRSVYSLRTPPLVPSPIQAEQELISCLKAASALPRRHGQNLILRRKPIHSNEDVDQEHAKPFNLQHPDSDLLPPPLVVRKRRQRSQSPLSPTQRQGHSRSHNRSHIPDYSRQQAVPTLVGENAHYANAQAVCVVVRGKGRIVTSRQNSVQQPPERSRPALVEAPGPASKADTMTDEQDGKERRDTTFAGANPAGKGKGREQEQEQEQDEDARSTTPSWRTNDSRNFSRGGLTMNDSKS